MSRIVRHIVSATAPVLLAATAASAQVTTMDIASNGPAPASAPRHTRLCDSLPAPLGFTRSTVFATLAVQQYVASDGWTQRATLAPDVLALALQEIASRVHVPAPLATPVFAVVADRATPVVDGEITFTLRGDGSVSHLRLLASTFAPALDSVVIAAIQDAGSTHALAALAGAPRDTVPLRLTLGLPEPGGVLRVLFALQLPVYRLDGPAAPLVHPRPAFPLVAWRNGVGGRVRLQFVVGRDGRAVPGTFRVLEAGYRELAMASLDAVSRWTFDPADIGGCAVPQLVHQEFTYSVGWRQ